MLKIRQENIDDYEQVYNVIKSAFEKAPHYAFAELCGALL